MIIESRNTVYASSVRTTRRRFLSAAAAATTLGFTAPLSYATGKDWRKDSLSFALIGAGLRGQGIIKGASSFARCSAICDVDTTHLKAATEKLARFYRESNLAAPAPWLSEDYREVLARPDVDAVFIATPDHWHAKMAIEALHAGKDVYCEKPLTLTIDEGRLIQSAVEQTGRTFLVGSQQRSASLFQNACALVRSGRLGTMQRVTCSLDGAPASGPLPIVAPPSELNWNRWLGPAPYVSYRQGGSLPSGGYGSQFPYGRGHAHFRWWYEYSGGKLTDWGAHHVDIAMWALDKSTGDIGPYKLEPQIGEHPTAMREGMPVEDDRFNTATKFHVRVTFSDGIELDIRHSAQEDLGFHNGVMFQGDSGKILVNRSKLVGKPVEEMEGNPISEEGYKSLHTTANPGGGGHMANFFNSIAGETTPISDVASHHRNLTVCHAANIALRLGRKLTYDPKSETFVNDSLANSFLKRDARKGYELTI